MALAPLSPAQWQVLRICWDLGGEVTVRQVRAQYVRRFAGLRDHRTVGTLLTQCEQRGYLQGRLAGTTKYFRPVVDREVAARLQCGRLLDEIGDDPVELEVLRRLLDERLAGRFPRRRSAAGGGS
jgi:predicted transcriptional regulator